MDLGVQRKREKMRLCLTIPVLVSLTGGLSAATLERLGMDEMIEKSTEIVRGRVVSSTTIQRGPMLYTVSRVQVLEGLKGDVGSSIDVAVRGGELGGLRQTFSGAPHFAAGAEYLLFLWTGRNGLTQVIGFSQGVFDIGKDKSGRTIAYRAATRETLLDPQTGREIEDVALSVNLNDLLAKIRRSAGARTR
jgi:hypothetical protein